MPQLTIKSTVRMSSGYFMPLLGFGVFQANGPKAAVLEAFKAGYRHVDSAQWYANEEEVGQAVRDSGLEREDVFVTTKIFGSNHGYNSTLRGVATSLKRFGFDYIDLFLIHDPLSGPQKRIDTYRALLYLQKSGKIRSVGVSNYGVRHLEELRAAGNPAPAVNQIELHPLCQQKEIVEYCKEKGIVVQAYCPIIRGKMGDEGIQNVAKKHGRDPAQILIRWSLQRGFVPLPKSSTPSRIHSNAEVYDFFLDGDDMAQLDALDRGKDGAISWNPVDAP